MTFNQSGVLAFSVVAFAAVLVLADVLFVGVALAGVLFFVAISFLLSRGAPARENTEEFGMNP